VSELGAVHGQAEGELGQGVGWPGSATDRRQCLPCGRRIGQVAKRSGLRKKVHNTGTGGNKGRNGRQLVHWGRCLYVGELGYKQDKERCGRSAGAVLIS
jgi:hypothetical protein